MTETLDPWERQPGEPNETYNRFHRYLTLPGKRSLLAAYNSERGEKGLKKATGCPDSWRSAFTRWRWEQRATAYDAQQRTLDQQIWQQRRDELRSLEWEMAQSGLRKAQEMLRMPIAKKTSEDGRTIIEPARWTFRDAIAILTECSALARKAAQMESDPALKQQLSMMYDLLRQIMSIEDGVTSAEVKQLVSVCLDTILLQLGKPVPEVREVLESAKGLQSDSSPPNY